MTAGFVIQALRSRAWLVVVCLGLAASLASGWSLFGPKSYTSSSVVLIGASGEDATQQPSLNDYLVARIASYSELSSSAVVRAAAGLPASVVHPAQEVGSGPVLQLSASGPTPASARRNARALTAAFERIAPTVNRRADGITLTVQQIDAPALPTRADQLSGPLLWAVALTCGLLCGVVSACGIAVARASDSPDATGARSSPRRPPPT